MQVVAPADYVGVFIGRRTAPGTYAFQNNYVVNKVVYVGATSADGQVHAQNARARAKPLPHSVVETPCPRLLLAAPVCESRIAPHCGAGGVCWVRRRNLQGRIHRRREHVARYGLHPWAWHRGHRHGGGWLQGEVASGRGSGWLGAGVRRCEEVNSRTVQALASLSGALLPCPADCWGRGRRHGLHHCQQ